MRRLQTDHLDLWQVHGVSFENDPELFIRPNGAAEALTQAKKEGKVRFVGFTGHKHPDIHLAMLKTGFPFDSVQMPLNSFDGQFRSFETHVLPELNRRGIAAIGMKPVCGHGEPVQKGSICLGGVICGNDRNLLDFNDISVDREGRSDYAGRVDTRKSRDPRPVEAGCIGASRSSCAAERT